MAINRNHDKRVFSEHNDTAIFDKDFNILWCDNKKLFHRIVVAHDRIADKLITTSDGETIVHFFLYHGRYYRARINKFGDGNFLCRIAKEIIDEELKIEELFEYIDDMAHNSLNVLSMTDALESYSEISGYNIDNFHADCQVQRREALGVYNKCQAIIKSFLNKDNDDFIPLQKYILRTWDVIQFATKKFPKTVEMYVDTVFPAIRVNYSKLEFALYTLVKLALIYSTGAKDPFISIRAVDCNCLEIETNFRLNTEFELANCSFEMHIIKHIFRLMGGRFELYEENNTLYAKGNFKMESSCRAEDITPGRDLKFIGDAELLEKKKNNDKYLKIYKRIPVREDMLASNTVDFSDVVEEDVKFAEMFFADIFFEE